MPTPDDVRRLALALPEAYEDTHRRKPAFRVNKRIFAMLGIESPADSPGFFAPLSGARPVASLTVDREDQLNCAAAYPQAFEPAGPHGFSYVWLDAIEPDVLALLIRMSWAKVAPKRLTLSRSD
ncbi:MAG TPA: MmcQ/YjbR family DNA-binding protein [Caulobacteraceae bacterium]|nr:MmcQ/YjbR family DNA-binding protein [Caulobacteraceae bacterium]